MRRKIYSKGYPSNHLLVFVNPEAANFRALSVSLLTSNRTRTRARSLNAPVINSTLGIDYENEDENDWRRGQYRKKRPVDAW
jgi:hypothetical protein